LIDYSLMEIPLANPDKTTMSEATLASQELTQIRKPIVEIPDDGESTGGSRWTLWWTLTALILPIVASLPLLVLEGLQVAESAPRRFVFLVIPILVLFYAISQEQMTGAVTKGRRLSAMLSVTAGFALFAASVWLYAPSINHAAIVLFVFGWSLIAYGSASWTRMFALAFLLALTVPLPGQLESVTLDRFDGAIASVSTEIFDGLGIPIFRDGKVLQNELGDLNVTWAVGRHFGIFAMLAFMQTIVIVRRQSLFKAALSLLLVPLWVVIIGSLHCLTIVLLGEFGTELVNNSLGRLSMQAVFAAGLIVCLVLTNFFVDSFFGVIRDNRETEYSFPLSAVAFNWVTGWPGRREVDTRLASRTKSPLLLASIVATLMIGLGVLPAFILLKSVTAEPAPPIVISAANDFPGAATFGTEIDEWKFVQFQQFSGDETAFAALTNQWEFSSGGLTLDVNLDMTPTGRKSVWGLMTEKGWKVLSMRAAEQIDSESLNVWPANEVVLQDESQLNTVVWTSLFDQNGRFDEAGRLQGTTSVLNRPTIIDRLNGKKAFRFDGLGQIRIQLTTTETIDSLTQTKVRNLMLKLRRQLVEQTLPVLDALNKET
jgi:hypothetical protein